MIKSFKTLFALAMAAMANATKTILQWTRRGGRWVLELVAAPAAPPAAPVNEAAAAVEALAEASAIRAPAPAPAPAVEAPHDPVAALGQIVLDYRRAQVFGSPEPDLTKLDDAARHWLASLTGSHHALLKLRGARATGEHMLQLAPIPGIPRCLTPAQYNDAHDVTERDLRRYRATTEFTKV